MDSHRRVTQAVELLQGVANMRQENEDLQVTVRQQKDCIERLKVLVANCDLQAIQVVEVTRRSCGGTPQVFYRGSF